MDTVNKEWNIKVDFITFYKFSVTEIDMRRQMTEEEKELSKIYEPYIDEKTRTLPLFLSNRLSYYAQSGYNNHNVSEIVAECFSVKDNNQFAKRFIQMLGEIMMMLKPTAEEKELIQKSKETTSQEELQKIQERLTKIYHQQIEELKKKGCPFVDD